MAGLPACTAEGASPVVAFVSDSSSVAPEGAAWEPAPEAASEPEAFVPTAPADDSGSDGGAMSDTGAEMALVGDVYGGTAEAANDVGPPDAPGAIDASAPCVTAGTELCDDFESGGIDPKKWQV